MPADASAQQIAHGLLRIAQLIRQEGYRGRERHGLSVTQAQLLALVHARGPMRVGAIARELGITSASASDSLRALETKGLIARTPAPEDRRASIVALTHEGRILAPQTGDSVVRLVDAAADLPESTRGDLLGALVDLIGGLVADGAIAPARMCTSCAWFAPNTHPGAARPHHCRYIDTPLGPADLRIDCAEHAQRETAGAPAPVP